MRCFLSYSYNTDISVIKKILTDYNIFSVSPTESLEYGNLIPEVIRRQIKDSDFVIAIFDESSNVSFEIGLAIGSKKPVFLIIPDKEEKDLPAFISVSTNVFSKPTDYEKIKYSFDLFIKKIATLSKTTARMRPLKKEKPKEKPTFNFLGSIEDVNKLRGNEFENYVGELFKKINIEVFAQNKLKEKDFQADFSIWIDKLNSLVGNPIIVETKSFANHNDLKIAIKQLSSYLKNYNSKAGLLIYNKPDGKSFVDLFSVGPLVISISIQDLIRELTQKSFSEILLELRNKAVHMEIC